MYTKVHCLHADGYIVFCLGSSLDDEKQKQKFVPKTQQFLSYPENSPFAKYILPPLLCHKPWNYFYPH